MPSLKIIGLEKSFGGQKTLSNFSLETAAGEFVVILGPSGCGKTTLLRLVAGLEEPDSGEIWIGRRRVDELPARQRKVALVFQNYALYPHMSVAGNLAFPLKVAGDPKEVIQEKVSETATLLGLADRLKARPSELSGGQRQRVALGRAIIREPDLFLLDEPLSNLDAELRVRMRRELVILQKKLGKTTIYVTHDQTEALTMADRLVVMESGQIRQIAKAGEIYEYPADLFVATFIGTPRMNIFEVTPKENITVPFNLPVNFLPLSGREEKVLIGIRPEDILIQNDGAHYGTVTAIEYLGDKNVLTVQYSNWPVTILSQPERYEIGDIISFSINPGRLHFFSQNSGKNITSSR